MTQARFLDAIKEDHKNGYREEFETEFKKEVKILLNKYHYPRLQKETLLDLFREVLETENGGII